MSLRMYDKWDKLDVESSDEEVHVESRTWGGMRQEWTPRPCPPLKAEPPSTWPVLVGDIRHHPDDDCLAYPPSMTTEPFVPVRNQVGRVGAWGLFATEAEVAEVIGTVRGVDRRLYARQWSPIEQFARRVVWRKPTIDLDERLLHLRISLRHKCESHCWRRFALPANTALPVLQDQILVAVTGSERGKKGYAFRDPTDGSALGPALSDFDDMPLALSRLLSVAHDAEVPIGALLRSVGDVAYYYYDFRVGWEWELRVEAVDFLDPEHETNVKLLGGRGADPPEDFDRGAQAYAAFLHDVIADPKKHQADVDFFAKLASNYRVEYVTNQPRPFLPLHFDFDFHADKLDSFFTARRLHRKSDLPPAD